MRHSLGFLGFLLLGGVCVAACSSASGQESELSECQPLAPLTRSVTLSTTEIVGAGQAADGTLYVVTMGDLEPRLFVLEGKLLVEQYVNGSGTGPGQTLVTYEDAQGVQHVLEIEGDGADRRMGIATGPLPDKTFVIGSVGEELTLVEASGVVAMPAQSTQTFHVDYAGETSDGTSIVVTAPDHASSYDDFRLFIGQVGALEEQRITTFDASLSGNKLVKFIFKGAPAEFDYESAVATASLSIGSKVESFSGDPAQQVAPTGAVFDCR